MKKFIIPIIVGIIVTATAVNYSQKTQDDIAQNVLRLHVLANSDTSSDQELKLKVRDRILRESSYLFAQSKSLSDTREILSENIDMLTAAANDEIGKNGFNYSAKISTGKYDFPTRCYENIALPAGKYEAVRVEIGEAKGKNWWCVMFPPLCFIDATLGETDEKSRELLKENLTESEYAIISTEDGELPVDIRFKLVDFFQNSVQEIKTAFKK